ncbi:1-(5-phosphoribosyl)-5-[(5-phosphoribosylamino)methylideneamino]imidazole-4-carboxamide isomerase [Peptostreptococcus faecalis]|uniref:1-(5-phosphoribosyl)-5-[(5- phosphoribosylamino)methylideneamino]imidazole-4- carboxamide isomerase n=1 Tax=Peptostreptococcus faecalis TaxID=2045015 RepID=UPI000C7E02E2|nr:1-(5-phosphoribosyl)-5-[(5-phosphoribosylamino)methylideneamino]imidazole-4-carboxamide isomerase [Peptostreptococcus faecalis]
MNIYPAIDIINGQAVRLTEGDYNKKKVYDEDPLNVANSFYKKGANHLHVVDLDGAKGGGMSNLETISKIIKNTSMFVEVGGGIRDESRIKDLISIGVGRVILGTVAVKNFEFLKEMVEKYGEKISVGVDTRDGYVAVEGWLETTKVSGYEFCKKLKSIGVKSIIYTDIATDGAMKGTNLDAFKELYKILNDDEESKVEITASGGVVSIEEVKELKKIGIDSVIIGKALYEGSIGIEELMKIGK